MPVLIDGNNLLHAALEMEDPERPIGRSMLCDHLGRWAQRRREQVHVVFDGPAPAPNLARQIGHRDIKVSYSGAGVSADAVLNEIIETDSAARRLIVVSTDRAIARVARRRRAEVVRSAEFWSALKKDLARPLPQRTEPEEKEAGLSPDATQQWLDEFGLS